MVQFGLILTHILTTFLTAIIAGIYVCVNILKLKDKEILKKLGINIICILGISSFFWVPMLETYTFTDYMVYQKDSMATKESFNESGLEIQNLLFTNQDATFVFELGIPILIMLCLSILAIKKGIDNSYKKEYILFLVLGLLCTFITLKQFPLGLFEKILQIMQFKWRMLLFSNFFFAIICGVNVSVMIKNFKITDIIVISTISLLYIMILIPFIPKNAGILEVDKYTIGDITGNKRETIVGMGKGEYLPVKADNNREYIKKRENTIYVIEGRGNIKEMHKDGETLTAKVDVLESGTILEFPYIYYPGYRVSVNGEIVQTFESKNGFLACLLTSCRKADIVVEYVGTNMMIISKIISVFCLIGFIIYVIYDNKRKNFKVNVKK